MVKTALWLHNRYEFNGLLKHQRAGLPETCSKLSFTFNRHLPIFPSLLTGNPGDGRLIGL
jgi:hypothetical protein